MEVGYTMSKKILCVEDNAVNSDIISVILEKSGYEVLVVSEGRSAISMALKFKPDLILMDLHLPGMNGVEATQLIKAHEQLAHIPIIAVTADIYARQSFFDAGGN